MRARLYFPYCAEREPEAYKSFARFRLADGVASYFRVVERDDPLCALLAEQALADQRHETRRESGRALRLNIPV